MIVPFLPGALVAFSINGFEKPNLSSVCLCYSNVISSRQRTELQSICMCDPIDGSPPGSAVPGILQARTLEWAAISFSKCIHKHAHTDTHTMCTLFIALSVYASILETLVHTNTCNSKSTPHFHLLPIHTPNSPLGY